MRIVPYEPWHARMIELQESQAYMREYLTEEDIHQRALSYHANTVMDGHDILFCGGTFLFWPGRGMLWSLISSKVDHRKMVGLHRIVTNHLNTEDYPARLEMVVDTDFHAGHRWASMIGFKHEAHMPSWGPDGRDADQYVRFF